MSKQGQGVPHSDKGARVWFRSAADQGLATAQFNTGFMYRNGQSDLQSDKGALVWYRKAANLYFLASC